MESPGLHENGSMTIENRKTNQKTKVKVNV